MSRFPIQANTRHMKMMAPMVYEVAGEGGSSASDVLFGISFTSITTTIAGYYAEKCFQMSEYTQCRVPQHLMLI